ncbi:MAG: cytochrome P450 [Planctomycetaceae bacterium]
MRPKPESAPANADPSASSANRGLPITHGRLLDFPENPLRLMRRLHREHGDIAALEQDGQRLVFIFSPEYNQQVLSDGQTFHSRFFAVRGPRNSPQRRVTSGLLSMNGETHKEHRRMVMGPFQKRSIAHYHEPICQLTEDMLADWQPGEVRDMHAEMTHYMLRVTSAILFGLDVPDFALQVGRLIDHWVEMNHETGMGAFVSDPQLLGNYDRLLGMAERLEQDLQQLVALRRAGDQNGTDVLSLLLRAHGEEGRIDDTELIGHVALLFAAAHLTTAHSLTWTLFLLAQHPSIMQALHEELRTAVAGDVPTPEEIEGLPLLERVIKESMRVLPASSYSQRIAALPTRLGPFDLPAGCPVVFSQFISHHRADRFEDPEAFKPERWLSIHPTAYEYLPFGAGPRMCIGGPLAMKIIKCTLPMILKRFRLTMVADATVDGRVISTMLGPTTSVPMHVAPADGRFESVPVQGNIHELVELREMPRTRRAAA